MEQLRFDLVVEPNALPHNPTQVELTRFGKMLLAGAGSPPELSQKVTVRWNNRLTSTAGLAYPQLLRVVLNPRLKDHPGELDRTLRHELAHLLARARAGRRRIAPHGREWQAACRDLGIPGESRCHTLPLPRRKINAKYEYACPKCGFILQRVRPLRTIAACRRCCKQHNKGRYSDDFRFAPMKG